MLFIVRSRSNKFLIIRLTFKFNFETVLASHLLVTFPDNYSTGMEIVYRQAYIPDANNCSEKRKYLQKEAKSFSILVSEFPFKNFSQDF